MTKAERILKRADSINGAMKCLVFAVILLMAVIVYHVLGRYLFGWRVDWCTDIELMGLALLFIVPMGYALLKEAHVRIDLVTRGLPPVWQEIITVVSCLLFIVPVALMVTKYGWDLFYVSWQVKQTSLTSAELPVYPMKFFIPVAGVLLLIQALIETVRHSILAVRRRKE